MVQGGMPRWDARLRTRRSSGKTPSCCTARPPVSARETPRTWVRKDAGRSAPEPPGGSVPSWAEESARLRAENQTAAESKEGVAAGAGDPAPGGCLFRTGGEVSPHRRDFIAENHAVFNVQRICRVLGVLRSGCYRHQATAQARTARQADQAAAAAEIRQIHAEPGPGIGRSTASGSPGRCVSTTSPATCTPGSSPTHACGGRDDGVVFRTEQGRPVRQPGLRRGLPPARRTPQHGAYRLALRQCPGRVVLPGSETRVAPWATSHLEGPDMAGVVPPAGPLQPESASLRPRPPHAGRVRTTIDLVTYAVTRCMKPGVHSRG